MRQIFDLFWTQFLPSHTLLWDGHKEVKYSGKNIHTYYQATDTFRGLFFKIVAKNRFSFLKMHGGPTNWANFHTLVRWIA